MATSPSERKFWIQTICLLFKNWPCITFCLGKSIINLYTIKSTSHEYLNKQKIPLTWIRCHKGQFFKQSTIDFPGVASSLTPRCCSYWKGSLLVTLTYSCQLYFILQLLTLLYFTVALNSVFLLLDYLLHRDKRTQSTL